MPAAPEGRGTPALLVCSPGGHLLQMMRLGPAWQQLDTTWVTLEAADSRHLLADSPVVFAHGPTNRSLKGLLANLRLAWRVVREKRPRVILSTGAALAVPFFLVGKLHGCRLVYVESLTRTEDLSLSGRIVYPLADAFFVQWPAAAARRRRARYVGGLV
ncbi:MAG TPA: PssD/Cps14F family polysaccharide biosynthesis glycosyltransferase [Solirubrobacterales bacterium]|nr:PssD/Cps14F family polysaccharide biosynthesis glycosyltransferase [Solirubrobacterales bacterium]